MLAKRYFRFIPLFFYVAAGAWVIYQVTAFSPVNVTQKGSNDSLRQIPSGQIISTAFTRTTSVSPILRIIQSNPNRPSAPKPSNFPSVGSLTVLTTFKAIDYTQTSQGIPPDPNLMVGKNHVVVSVNGSFQVFDKNGNSLISPTLFKNFWDGSCGTGSATMVLTSPFSTYDEQYGRYILGITGFDSAVNDGQNAYLCIAVSQTDSATGQWYLYNFNGNPGPGQEYSLNFPRLATGQNALYLGAMMFSNIAFVRNHLYAFDKTAMYAGGNASLVKLDVNNNYVALVPADIKGYSSGGWPTDPIEPHYFIEAEFGAGDELRLFSFNDPWGSPSISLVGTIPVSSYNHPLEMPQAGSINRINGLDDRLMDAEYWNGRIWTTHSIQCNPNGSNVNCLRWYELNVNDPLAPALVQEGTFGSGSDFRSYPNLAVNACGDMLTGYTKTSDDIFPGVYVAGREFRDASGQLKDETELHAGEVDYLDFGGQPYRWGNFTGTTIDPDGKTFWHLGEYSRLQPIARWSTWVGSFSWSDCNILPTPTPSPGPSPTASQTPTPPPPTTTPEPMNCTTYQATNVPVPLPNNTFAISSTITIPDNVQISDVNVQVMMGHSWVGDLLFKLTHLDSGTVVTLMDRPGHPVSQYGCDGDDVSAVFDDQINSPVEYECAPKPPAINGTLSPQEPLAGFNGQNSSGSWTLTIEDHYPPEDSGQLTEWAVEICSPVIPSPTATSTSSSTPTKTATATQTSSPTPSPTSTTTNTPTNTPTINPSPTSTATMTVTFTPTIPKPNFRTWIPLVLK